ncbi:Bacterial regulatory s, tetR family protein [Operophtera brumata]|uniref:Bacterial regulatory s, tetR family protein n=1 Tax=Operophtera brumata TaxID=104452 RepID=A0A0L7LSP8_OPEBR|nr:Bacterial regulatory s, tetR family protein [Operophtera brumata]
MTESPKSTHSARSRAPIDEAGVTWWDNFGNQDTRTIEKDVKLNNEPKFKDKSTNTNILARQREATSILYHNFASSPKDRVLGKWKEERAKVNYEKARNAIISSLKEKFREPNQGKIDREEDGKKAGNGKTTTFIEIIGDNVEETSNSNVNRDVAVHSNLDLKLVEHRVEFSATVDEDVSHASSVQMGPGGEVAQCRLGARGSRAAGAVGGKRGLFTESMPVSTRELLTIRSAQRNPSDFVVV